jgi:hypothetical protein
MKSHEEADLVVHEVHDTAAKNPRFPSRLVVLKDSPESESRFKFLLKGDDVGMGDDVVSGDVVSVSFHIEGREWTSPEGRLVTFTELVIEKLDNVSAAQQVAADAPPPPKAQEEAPAAGDDVPF